MFKCSRAHKSAKKPARNTRTPPRVSVGPALGTTLRKCANPILSPCKRSGREQQFFALWRAFVFDLPAPVEQHMFHPTRKWRFDFAWPDSKLAVEIEGGTWSKKAMAHRTGSGIQRDCHKGNAAIICGWRVLRYTATDLDKRPLEVLNEVRGLLVPE